MPTTIHDSHGIGFDSTFPNPNVTPVPVTNFRWDRTDGILKWDKASDDEMTGGNYHIQYSDNNGTTWTDLTDVAHDGISGTTGQYQDPIGTPDRVYQIKKITSAANGETSSIYVGYDVEYEDTDDRCYVMIYVRQLDLSVDNSMVMKAAFDVASTTTHLNYKNKSIVPVLEQSVAIEPYSGLLILPLIPTADLTLPGTSTTVKYDITIMGKNGFKAEYTTKVIPKQSSAWVRDLTAS